MRKVLRKDSTAKKVVLAGTGVRKSELKISTRGWHRIFPAFSYSSQIMQQDAITDYPIRLEVDVSLGQASATFCIFFFTSVAI